MLDYLIILSRIVSFYLQYGAGIGPNIFLYRMTIIKSVKGGRNIFKIQNIFNTKIISMYVTTLCVNIKNPLYLCVIICFSRNDLSGSVVRSLRVDNLFPDGSQADTNVLHCILLS